MVARGRWSRIVVGTGVVTAALVAIGVIVSGQTAAGPATTTEALLAEVRGLRADVNQVAGASIRTQLLVARLQLQEQRINGLSKQLTDTQQQRVAIEGGVTQMQTRLKQLEEAARDPSLTPEHRRGIEGESAGMTPALAQMRRRLQQLSEQENAFSGQLSSEQSRWLEFNDRLDQIEREIARK